MNEQEQRIAIAAFCGYTGIRYDWINGSDAVKDWLHDKGRGIPDYCNDLNAMHEAEPKAPRYAYYKELCKVVCGGLATCVDDWAQIVSAAAPQRAEAFLRTIGKWRDA